MITITDTELETTLKSLLQQRVNFILHKKVWRSGKVLLFKQSGFYIEFTIHNNKDKIEKFEVPIPFNINSTTKSVRFSYDLNDLFCNREEIVNEVKKLVPNCRSKYYNSSMEMILI